MLKKTLLIFLFPLVVVSAQHYSPNASHRDERIANYQQLSSQQLLDTANYYFNKNLFETALVCYNLLINTHTKSSDLEHQKRIVEALHKSAGIHYFMCDYRTAYELYIKALLLCEKIEYKPYETRIYNNIGNIYYRFNKFDIAKYYYTKALSLCQDSTVLLIILNNLGSVELENNEIDSAFHFLNKALRICNQYPDAYSHDILRNIATCYQKRKLYDSAYHYYHLSLEELKRIKIPGKESEAENLSDLGKLFFEINKPDSALHYIGLSNIIAEENNFSRILADNYLTLSKKEETKGNIKKAFEYYKVYANLKNSIFSNDIFGDINQLQRMYEVAKTNQEIEQLVIEKQIKERTIHLHRIIVFVILCILLLVTGGLLYIYFQKRNLNKAYKILVEKNMKIIELQEKESEKNTKSALPDNIQDELLDKILTVMEDTSMICDTEFSLDKMAELIQSNHAYVSQVINTALKKNFRSFLNSYRIQEAQRLLASDVAQKYTIETIALNVGFKSQTAFREAFKEQTGVNPYFYLKSMREKFDT
ncbi:MAG: AraC family transcriptional regulator [Bacteroidetes bacterium]|nr:AraC family transcriptional regulator [Bacteroidota bacterium]MCL2302058.1 AraC family transcriptional regulator [Lentimicrobiaceae bacterium]